MWKSDSTSRGGVQIALRAPFWVISSFPDFVSTVTVFCVYVCVPCLSCS